MKETDIVVLKDSNGIYAQRLIKHILTVLFLPFVITLFFTIANHEGVDGFLIIFMILSPLSFLLIGITIYKYSYYITSIKQVDNRLEFCYYKFGTKKYVSMDISSCEILFRIPMLSRIENYVFILKLNGQTLIRQYEYDDWTIDLFKLINQRFEEISGLKVDSVIRVGEMG